MQQIIDRHRRGRSVRIAIAATLIASSVSGCARLQTHEGFIVDQALVDSVSVGIDNRASVERTLGRPTFASQFGAGEMVTADTATDWYYVSRNTRALAFANPRAVEQANLHVRFDTLGNVSGVTRSGMEDVVRINPESDITPTLGRSRSFFEDIFGNIGSVGAGGAGGAPGGRTGGGSSGG